MPSSDSIDDGLRAPAGPGGELRPRPLRSAPDGELRATASRAPKARNLDDSHLHLLVGPSKTSRSAVGITDCSQRIDLFPRLRVVTEGNLPTRADLPKRCGVISGSRVVDLVDCRSSTPGQETPGDTMPQRVHRGKVAFEGELEPMRRDCEDTEPCIPRETSPGGSMGCSLQRCSVSR